MTRKRFYALGIIAIIVISGISSILLIFFGSYSPPMGQLIEWPEVITEGESLEECREMLQDALQEMVSAYHEQHKEIPVGRALLEQMLVEVEHVG